MVDENTYFSNVHFEPQNKLAEIFTQTKRKHHREHKIQVLPDVLVMLPQEILYKLVLSWEFRNQDTSLASTDLTSQSVL